MSLVEVAQSVLRRLKSNGAAPRQKASMVEPLEQRTHLSGSFPIITSLVADNRGYVEITLSHAVVASTVSRGTVQMFTAGLDRVLNTKDDVKVTAPVTWDPSSNQIDIQANLPANTLYRVRVISARIHDSKGLALDGEYTGTFPTGNGKGGGDSIFKTRVDSGSAPKVQLNTSAGIMTITMFKSQKPITVNNFLDYANAGDYDNLFFTRSVSSFLIEAGGLQLDPTDTMVQATTQNAPIENEFTENGVISNTRGTIAFAKNPGDPDSATNQFFFNLSDNGGTSPLGLDYQNGGFTVFAKVADKASLNVMDAIAAFPTVALNNPFTGDGVVPVFPSVSLTSTPVQDVSPLRPFEKQENFGTSPQYVTIGGLQPSRDLLIIQRTAELMRVQAIL